MRRLVVCGVVFLFFLFFSGLAGAGHLSDLTVGGVWLSPVTIEKQARVLLSRPGETVRVSVEVANVGKGFSPEALGQIFISPKKVVFWDPVVVDFAIPPLFPGEIAIVEVDFFAPTEEGRHYVLVWLDPKNKIRESNEENNRSDKNNMASILIGKNFRNADICNILKYWYEVGEITTEQLAYGRVEHDYGPAELLAYSVIENPYNPLIALVFMEMSQNLISEGKNYGDFELRIRGATGYGVGTDKEYKWRGYAVQLVCALWQAGYDRGKGKTFRQFVEEYFISNEYVWNEFVALYSKYTKQLNQYLGTSFRSHPPTDEEYFFDFSQLKTDHLKKGIQWFFEENKSPLADEKLFAKHGKAGSSVDYDNPNCPYPPASFFER